METETKALWETTREAMGRTYTIALFPNNAALEDGNVTCNLAAVESSRQQIRVNALMPCDGRDASLLHEVLHLVNRYCAHKMDEDEVQRMAEILYTLLRGFGLWQPFPWPDKDE